MSRWTSARAVARAGIDVATSRVRLPGPRPAGALTVRVGGRTLWAEPRRRATPAGVTGEVLAEVDRLLAEAGLEPVAIPTTTRSALLAVRQPDAVRAVAALRGLGVGWYVAERVGRRLLRVTPADELDPDEWRAVRVLAVLRPVTDPGARRVIGVGDDVRVEVWAPARGGHAAPVANPWADLLPDGQPFDAEVSVCGAVLRTSATLVSGPIDAPPFPIDAVYTWVDGTDDAWRARMIEARAGAGGVVGRDTTDARFRDLDELRFSLRALEAHAPWIRHVWLVTDAQVPGWLAEDHPRLTVVSHRDIWSDRSQLPVFNSHAIEANLHHIDGLAEHYLYFNDDVLLTRPVDPADFFSPGGVLRFHPSRNVVGLGPPTDEDSAPVRAMKNNRRLLLEAVGAVPACTLWHMPHAQRRSVQYELEARFPDDYRRTSGSRFRGAEDISPISLHQWYAYRTGRAVPGTLTYRYVDVIDEAGLDKLGAVGRRRDIDVVCVNMSDEPTVPIERLAGELTATLGAWFPFVSSFETDGDERPV